MLVIVITASNPKQAKFCLRELQVRKEEGIISKDTLILSVPDPEGARIGSGGGTINAIFYVAKYLSDLQQKKNIDISTLDDKTVLIIHSGGDSQRCPTLSVCGKAWSFFPCLSNGNLISNVDLLLNTFHSIVKPGTFGVFVFCGDVLVNFDPGFKYEWREDGITGLSLPVKKAKGPEHGVYHFDFASKKLLGYYQKESIARLEEIGAVSQMVYNGVLQECVLLDTGVIFIPPQVCSTLLTLFMQEPLSNSTFLGVNEGHPVLRLELYSDILNAIGNNLDTHSQADYMNLPSENRRSSMDLTADILEEARVILWEKCSDISFYCNCPETGSFFHTGTTEEFIDLLYNPLCRAAHHFEYRVLCKIPSTASIYSVSSVCTIMNTMINSTDSVEIGDFSVIEHSSLQGNISIGKSCWVSGIRSLQSLKVPDELCIQEIPILDSTEKMSCVFIIFGIHDNIKGSYRDKTSTFCNISWPVFCDKYKLLTKDLWSPTLSKSQWNIWNASLFPIYNHTNISECTWFTEPETSQSTINNWKSTKRLSLKEILLHAQSIEESQHRWNLMKTIKNN